MDPFQQIDNFISQIPDKLDTRTMPDAESLGQVQKYVQSRSPMQELDDYIARTQAPTQAERYDQAKEWADQRRGSEKEGINVLGMNLLPRTRVRDVKIPVASAIMDTRNQLKVNEARKAFDAGKASDEQLGILAEDEYERERSKTLGLGGRIANAVGSAPAIVGETFLAGPVMKAGTAGAARMGLGRIASPVAGQAVGAAAMPSLWLQQSAARAGEQGGNWYDPENIAPPLAHAALSNAVLGSISKATGLGEKSIIPRSLAGAAAMPVEQGAADALATMADRAMQKVGIDKKWQTRTEYGTFGKLAKGESGEALQEFVVQAFLGAGFAAMHGKQSKLPEKAVEAIDEIAKKGATPEQAGVILQEAMKRPPEEIKSAPIRSLVEEMASIPGFDAIKKAAEPPKPPVPAPIAPEPARRPLTQTPAPMARLGRMEKPAEPVETVTQKKGPLEDVPAELKKDLAKGLGVKPADLDKMPANVQQALYDSIFFKPGEQPAKPEKPIYADAPVTPVMKAPEPPKPPAEPSLIQQAVEQSYGKKAENITAQLGQEGYTVPYGDRFVAVTEVPGSNRVDINFDYAAPQEGSTTKPAPLGIQPKTKELISDLTTLVKNLNEKHLGIQYVADPAKGAGGRTSRADLYTRILEKNGYRMVQKGDATKPFVWEPHAKPELTGEKNATLAAERSRETLESIAEAIRDGEEAGLQVRKDQNASARQPEKLPEQTGQRPEAAAVAGDLKNVGKTDLFGKVGPELNEVEKIASVLGVKPRVGAKFAEGAPSGGIREKLLGLADQWEQEAVSELKKFRSGEKLMSISPEMLVPLTKFAAAKIIKGGITFADFTAAAIQNFGEGIRPHLNTVWANAEKMVADVQPREAPKPQPEKTSQPVPPRDATSTKNAVTEQERMRRGLPPAAEADPVGHEFPELVDEVNRIAKSDSAMIDRMLAEFRQKPRAVDDLENALLLRRQTELQNRYDRLAADYKSAADPAAKVLAANELAVARSELRDIYDIGKKVGTATGRGLNARRMMMERDYTLARIETEYERTAGRPLAEKDRAWIEKAHGEIERLKKELASAREEAIAERAKSVPKKPELGNRTVKAQKEVEEAWDALKAVTKGKLFSAEAAAGEAIVASTKLAKAYIKLGVAKFADFVESVRSKAGHDLEPEAIAILEKGWNAAQSEPPVTPKTTQIEAHLKLAEKKVDQKYVENEQVNETAVRKGIRRVGDLMDLQRSVFLGLDMPPLLRQGGFITAGRPLLATKAFKDTAKAFKSSENLQSIGVELSKRENATNGQYQRHLKLDVENPVGHDEFAVGRLTGKIPVLSNLQRWHDAFNLKIQADLYDVMTAGLSRTGRATEAEQALIGNAVRVFAGKGNLYQAEQMVGALNKVFLAPRYVASRFQLAGLQPLWHGIGKFGLQPRARLAIAKEYTRASAGVGAIYAMVGGAIASGLLKNTSVESDPRSTDFGEIRINNTRINPLFGLSQVIRFGSQFLSGKAKDVESKQIYKKERAKTVGNEFRFKLAPLPSSAWTGVEMASGQKPQKPFPQSPKELAISLIQPLTTKDLYDASKDLGVGPGLVAWLLGSLGANVKSYQPKQ